MINKLRWWLYRVALRYVCSMSETHRRLEDFMKVNYLSEAITRTAARFYVDFVWKRPAMNPIAEQMLKNNPLLDKLRKGYCKHGGGGRTYFVNSENMVQKTEEATFEQALLEGDLNAPKKKDI